MINKFESINSQQQQLTIFLRVRKRRFFRFLSDRILSYKTLESLVVSQRRVS